MQGSVLVHADIAKTFIIEYMKIFLTLFHPRQLIYTKEKATYSNQFFNIDTLARSCYLHFWVELEKVVCASSSLAYSQ